MLMEVLEVSIDSRRSGSTSTISNQSMDINVCFRESSRRENVRKNPWIERRARPERRTKWADGSESKEGAGARQTKNKTERDPRGGGGSKRWREASIIIIEGNGAEAPWSSALFYISSPDPDAPAPALGSSTRPASVLGVPSALPAPAAPRPGRATLKFWCSHRPPDSPAGWSQLFSASPCRIIHL